MRHLVATKRDDVVQRDVKHFVSAFNGLNGFSGTVRDFELLLGYIAHGRREAGLHGRLFVQQNRTNRREGSESPAVN